MTRLCLFFCFCCCLKADETCGNTTIQIRSENNKSKKESFTLSVCAIVCQSNMSVRVYPLVQSWLGSKMQFIYKKKKMCKRKPSQVLRHTEALHCAWFNWSVCICSTASWLAGESMCVQSWSMKSSDTQGHQVTGIVPCLCHGLGRFHDGGVLSEVFPQTFTSVIVYARITKSWGKSLSSKGTNRQ